MADISKDTEKFTLGLDNFINNGYVILESFEDSAGEALDYLHKLYSLDEKLGETYYKKIFESECVYDDFLKSICFDHLLLSENEWDYAFNYLNENSERLTVPVLKVALFYFYCAKKDKEPHPVPDDLFKKLIKRYQIVKNDESAKFYNLNEDYGCFVNAYLLDGL
ncbi:hypothetical protein I2492_10870 [Budviciaceae bacterium CWB-B4]|uniref:Uncharacterized protein n=1 Tax=Limnobaculum xujianqingii TaxID=2738837 RepID=A0A9D7FTV9_9GAMM|nr:hypothetical protein [Limnobaculum xujianqingii]MBK5073446.1 hypothetical protein [Limnobaculum xujianqingii]MBK5176823.1 hypothetical protein [Limnobaculum xujianqingii]